MKPEENRLHSAGTQSPQNTVSAALHAAKLWARSCRLTAISAAAFGPLDSDVRASQPFAAAPPRGACSNPSDMVRSCSSHQSFEPTSAGSVCAGPYETYEGSPVSKGQLQVAIRDRLTTFLTLAVPPQPEHALPVVCSPVPGVVADV